VRDFDAAEDELAPGGQRVDIVADSDVDHKMVGATGFESKTTAFRFSQLAHNRPVFIRYCRLLIEVACEWSIRSCERFTVRTCQEIFRPTDTLQPTENSLPKAL
jgi:hypothetical protein